MRASYCIALAALFAAAFYVAPPTSAAAPALAAPVAPLSPKRESVIEFLRCMAREGATMTSGHRGGVAPGYPENAVETFAHTLSVAPMLIEGDTRLTKDGAVSKDAAKTLQGDLRDLEKAVRDGDPAAASDARDVLRSDYYAAVSSGDIDPDGVSGLQPLLEDVSSAVDGYIG